MTAASVALGAAFAVGLLLPWRSTRLGATEVGLSAVGAVNAIALAVALELLFDDVNYKCLDVLVEFLVAS